MLRARFGRMAATGGGAPTASTDTAIGPFHPLETNRLVPAMTRLGHDWKAAQLQLWPFKIANTICFKQNDYKHLSSFRN